jgi:putative ABC transport system substrate-binding protein
VRRREFITLIGGAAAAWPIAARAQHAGNRATIGFLNANTGQTTDALVGRLSELGWSDGRNLTIEYRWTDGRSKHLPELAAELVARKVDLIVAAGTPSVLAVKHATSTIPIVFVGIADPVGIGVVESLARPGGNATGVSQQATDTGGKRLELLYEAVGGLRRVAVLVNVGNLYTPLEIDRNKRASAGALCPRRWADIHAPRSRPHRGARRAATDHS